MNYNPTTTSDAGVHMVEGLGTVQYEGDPLQLRWNVLMHDNQILRLQRTGHEAAAESPTWLVADTGKAVAFHRVYYSILSKKQHIKRGEIFVLSGGERTPLSDWKPAQNG